MQILDAASRCQQVLETWQFVHGSVDPKRNTQSNLDNRSSCRHNTFTPNSNSPTQRVLFFERLVAHGSAVVKYELVVCMCFGCCSQQELSACCSLLWVLRYRSSRWHLASVPYNRYLYARTAGKQMKFYSMYRTYEVPILYFLHEKFWPHKSYG